MRQPRAQVQGVLGAAAIVGIGLAMSSAGSGAGVAQGGGDRDCADFATQRHAQAFFEASGPGDPHRLDGDGDGRACEDLPCPCDSGGGGNPEGGGNPGGGGGRDLRKRATVTDVADGDTIEARQRGRLRDVRLVGIDTPEVFFGAECGGAEASDSIKRMLEVGDKVTLVRDPTQDNRDAFDRLLRYLERRGRDVGRRQIRRGWAKVFVFESPFQRVGKYRRAEKQARARDRGVWGRCGGDFHQPL